MAAINDPRLPAVQPKDAPPVPTRQNERVANANTKDAKTDTKQIHADVKDRRQDEKSLHPDPNTPPAK